MPDIDISPLAVLSCAWLCLMTEAELIPAVILPILIHEAAHIAAMKLSGMRINALRLEVSGLCIDYCGFYGYRGQFFIALAGPAAGLVYAYAASFLASRYTSSLLSMSAGVSLLFSLFNLLPALPLDGGRMLEAVFGQYGKNTAKYISLCIGLFISGAGAYLMYCRKGAALFIAGCAIIIFNIKHKA